MTAEERVSLALNRQEPDRVPTWEKFWPEFIARWRVEKGLGADADPHVHYAIDASLPPYDHAPCMGGRVVLEVTEAYEVYRDG